MTNKKMILQTTQVHINMSSFGTLHKIVVPKGSEFIGCTTHEYKNVSVSFAYLQPSFSSSDEVHVNELDCHRYLILSDMHHMPYVNYRHIASFSKTVVSDSVVSQDGYTILEIHVFEITHPQKVGDDCQGPCEWDDEDE